MTEAQKRSLLELARAAIASRFGGEAPHLPTDAAFQEKRGLFVTITLDGELRGCIGMMKSEKSIAAEVVEMAREAAFGDPRFPALRRDELPRLQIEISILSPLFPVENLSEIQIGRDGLMLRKGFRSGVFLPQVPVEYDWDLDTYLSQLCLKAGLPNGAWKSPDAHLFRFEALVFSEADILA
ncbi:MAG: AmmeMemoRadiSam system protein A [Candidatus Cloacimonadaceae bacterium]|jgi:AmmeMemoRadiSam system protein A|nr:AmmeMemoRadiSam system protein A [Candidatus Cloacimonadota bacterium]MDX9950312.1 AmmeMemoRadiSam system protein A [Candidatus Syntrophosphaera sp.]